MADDVTIITLFTCKCDKKCVAKEKYLKDPKVIKNHFRIKEPCSILNPIIELTASNAVKAGVPLAHVNYCYIHRFDRYYFIDDITFENDGLIELKLSVDVLMSYADSIYGSQQEVIRSEALNSPKFIDNERPILSDKIVTTKLLGNLAESTGNNYYMTVAGG